MPSNAVASSWPELPYDAWRDTCETLHLWLQIAGKIQLAQLPWTNHSWHAALQVTARGVSTRLTPHEAKAFQIEFDFIAHRLVMRAADGAVSSLPLEPQPTLVFYRRVMSALTALGAPVSINTMPSELPNPIRFDVDDVHRSYDREFVHRYFRALVNSQRVLEQFRARFVGKCSPVHFFWGAADLAVTRFSGRAAPLHPGGVPNLPDWVTQEAYSHEVSSAGFWAGGPQYPSAIFYSYAYPEPPGFADAPAAPAAAHYSNALREFVLPYDEVRCASHPDAALLEFLQGAYDAAATLGDWDRNALERPHGFAPS